MPSRIAFKKACKIYEEKAGHQYIDDMTPSKAAGIRSELIEGRRLTMKEKRKREKAQKDDQVTKAIFNNQTL
ncbi:MAG: hypothetical protein H8D45_26065 [Bacteroidetes bacterium]|nr:hypothetical protein [Bacteroidota bacterium]